MQNPYDSLTREFKKNLEKRLFKLSREGRSVPDVTIVPELGRLRPIINDQLIVEFKEKPTEELLNGIRTIVGIDVKGDRREFPNVRIKRVSHCNPKLVLLEGPDIQILISPDTETLPPVQGSSANDIYIPVPVKMLSPSEDEDQSGLFEEELKRIEKEFSSIQNYPVVAVMDTGIDFGYANTKCIPIQYNGGTSLCNSKAGPDYIGWDFVNDQNNPYDDDTRNKHGSRISAIISKVTDKKVRILPLKVINSDGFGSLFDILCGFDYLLSDRMHGQVHIINASWGFYGHESPLMERYISRLRDNGVWLINAAGNKGDIKEDDLTNLDEIQRFPACYSEAYSNVLTVTTVKSNLRENKLVKLEYEVVENYSSRFVNTGVGSGLDGMFAEPLVNKKLPPIDGSSYATAYISGFAANLARQSVMATTQEELLKAMPKMQIVKPLAGKIREGLIIPVESDLPIM